jgi:shikimate kinase
MADGPCRVLLIGMMGSGKSTIGRLLSAATGWPYVDNDELVHRSHGATARQILAEHGEARMRAAESDALALGLTTQPPALIGVAAGTIIDPANRASLAGGGVVVVWLRADAAALESRAMGAGHRPWLDTGGASWIRDAIAERDPLYASVADVVVDTDSSEPEQSADEVRARLRTVPACRAALSSLEPPARDP